MWKSEFLRIGCYAYTTCGSFTTFTAFHTFFTGLPFCLYRYHTAKSECSDECFQMLLYVASFVVQHVKNKLININISTFILTVGSILRREEE